MPAKSKDPAEGALTIEGVSVLTINDTNGNGSIDLEAPLRTLEERAREFRTGKRIVEVPGGGAAVLKLPSSNDLDTAQTMTSVAFWKLKREGLPFMTELADFIADPMEKERYLDICRDEKKDFLQKKQEGLDLLSKYGLEEMFVHTVDSRSEQIRWGYLLEHCILDEHGKNFWEAAGFGSFAESPTNAISRYLMNEFFRFMGDAQSPLYSNGSPSPPGDWQLRWGLCRIFQGGPSGPWDPRFGKLNIAQIGLIHAQLELDALEQKKRERQAEHERRGRQVLLSLDEELDDLENAEDEEIQNLFAGVAGRPGIAVEG